jgi:hypothetical protein
MAVFVVVSGPPGSGKTTLAVPLAAKLGLPLIAKDVIKEALMDALGPPSSVEDSRQIGRAAGATMIAVAKTSPGAVLENAFTTEAVPSLRSLPGTVVEVRCVVPRELALARYRERATTRHSGHMDALRTESEIWSDDLITPLGFGSVIEVDTSTNVDLNEVVRRIRAAASSDG